MAQYPQIGVRVDNIFLKRLDAWRRSQPELPTRPEALRRLADLGLTAGKPPKTRRGARAIKVAKLNASNDI